MGVGFPMGSPSPSERKINMYYKVWAIVFNDFKIFTTDYINFVRLSSDPNIFILKFEELKK